MAVHEGTNSTENLQNFYHVHNNRILLNQLFTKAQVYANVIKNGINSNYSREN